MQFDCTSRKFDVTNVRRKLKQKHRRFSQERKGFALEASLILLVMFSIIILAGLSAVTTLAKTSNADYRASRASYAAEGGADDIMSQLDAKMQDGIISASDISTVAPPEVRGFEITQQTNTTGIPVSRTIIGGPFAGLYSLNQPIDIRVSARDSSGNRATAILSVNAQTIPLFQFGVFYEGDLEILPGQPMTFAGWVHTNGMLYLSSNSAKFESEITTPDSVIWNRKDTNQRLNGVRINNAGGTANLLDFDSRSLAGAAFVARSQSQFSGRVKTGVSGVRSLKLPLPLGTPPVTLIMPRVATDPQLVKDVKMAWKADWYITIDASLFTTANLATMEANFCSSIFQTRTAGLQIPSASACKRIFKPRPNAFYDGREDLLADLVDVHMDSLRIWADSAPASRAPRIMYFAFTNTNTSPTNDYVAIRLRGGTRLPKAQIPSDTGGVSIVTNRQMYVLGDFNTTVWRPAALMADAITFLSNPPNPSMSVNDAPSGGVKCTGNTGWCDSLQLVEVTARVARPTAVNLSLIHI